jgi:hypothetical protein
LDASGGGVFRNWLGAAEDALIRAAASTQPFDGFHSSEENMAIESSPCIVSTTVLGLRQ